MWHVLAWPLKRGNTDAASVGGVRWPCQGLESVVHPPFNKAHTEFHRLLRVAVTRQSLKPSNSLPANLSAAKSCLRPAAQTLRIARPTCMIKWRPAVLRPPVTCAARLHGCQALGAPRLKAHYNEVRQTREKWLRHHVPRQGIALLHMQAVGPAGECACQTQVTQGRKGQGNCPSPIAMGVWQWERAARRDLLA
jgi:hypothetical protein